MNQTDTFDEHDDDAALESLLSPLKRIEPSPAARSEIRAAVAAELAGAAPIRTQTPWWRRSIQVPVPVALLAALLLLVSVAWTRRVPQDSQVPAAQPQATAPAPSPAAVSSPDAIAATPADFRSPELEYYSTETYVCGIGPISSVSGYTIRENNHVP